jgi:uroporphyrinogen III methyltransferase / synthase
VAEAPASPLLRKRIVITRAALQTSELFEKLSGSGAIPILLPLVSLAAPEDYAPLDSALLQLSRFDWVMFTSAYAVQAVMGRAARLGRKLANSAPPYIAVVGPATQEKAQSLGFRVEHTAQTHLGVALAQELRDRLRGRRVMLPRSDRANPDLPSALKGYGAQVTEVIAYRTLRPTHADQEKLASIARGEADAILFFSPSAVRNFVELSGRKQLSVLQDRTAMTAIGPVTAAALRELGVHRIVQASEPTASAVLQALESRFAQRP